MTVKEMKMALAALGSGVDDFEFRIWLPGSEIYLCGPDGRPQAPIVSGNKVLFEGNQQEN